MRSWQQAWHDALYGPDGFYRAAGGPAAHFTTSTHGERGETLAVALIGLAHEVGAGTVIDLGAGRGELLTALASTAPDLRLAGVDVVERPGSLPERVAWHRSPGGADLPDLPAGAATDALVVAHEWLDVVPCPVAEVDAEGELREVHVDADGRETLGEPLTGDDREWAGHWWPTTAPGARVEVGRARDDAWAGMLDAWRPAAAVAIDYGHTRGTRPAGGSLVGYRAGRQVPPVPDGRADLTAHVAVDSLRQHGRLDQAEAVRRWAPQAAPPDPGLARTDPAVYLRAVSARSARTALVQGPAGGFSWVIWCPTWSPSPPVG